MGLRRDEEIEIEKDIREYVRNVKVKCIREKAKEAIFQGESFNF